MVGGWTGVCRRQCINVVAAVIQNIVDDTRCAPGEFEFVGGDIARGGLEYIAVGLQGDGSGARVHRTVDAEGARVPESKIVVVCIDSRSTSDSSDADTAGIAVIQAAGIRRQGAHAVRTVRERIVYRCAGEREVRGPDTRGYV